MRKRLTQQLVAGVIGDQDIVLLRRPVDPSAITHRSSFGTVRQRPDLEVPLRVLIDKALNGATSCRRSRHLTTGGRGWSFAGPPSRASDRGPLPTVAEAKRSLTYERSSAGWTLSALSGSLRRASQMLARSLEQVFAWRRVAGSVRRL